MSAGVPDRFGGMPGSRTAGALVRAQAGVRVRPGVPARAGSSRQRVLDCFARRRTEGLPAWFGSSPEFIAKALEELGLPDEESLRRLFGDDFRRVSAVAPEDPEPLSSGATWRSPFGVERTGLFYGEPMTHPLAEHSVREALADYPWPDPDRVDVSGVAARAEGWCGEYAILGGEWSPFFHDAVDLVGMETLFILMYEDPDFVEELLDRVNGYYLAVSRRIFEATGDEIDIYFIGNDFGSQRGPLVGPELFRRFFAPHLASHARLAHEFGKPLMLHCCGGVRELVPVMAEAGIDALHALQPDCSGMESAAFARDFGDLLVLNGGIDSHGLLINGTPELVRSGTRATLAAMTGDGKGGQREGGYIAGASHDYILPETPVENVVAMFEEISAWRN